MDSLAFGISVSTTLRTDKASLTMRGSYADKNSSNSGRGARTAMCCNLGHTKEWPHSSALCATDALTRGERRARCALSIVRLFNERPCLVNAALDQICLYF